MLEREYGSLKEEAAAAETCGRQKRAIDSDSVAMAPSWMVPCFSPAARQSEGKGGGGGGGGGCQEQA